MLATPDLNGGMSAFLAARDFAVLTARDADGRLWTSPIFSSPGFLEARDRELRVHAVPGPGDPLRRPRRGPAGRHARHRVRHPPQGPGQRHPHRCQRRRSAAFGRPGIRQLPQVHSPTPSRSRGQLSAACRTFVDAERRAPRAHHDMPTPSSSAPSIRLAARMHLIEAAHPDSSTSTATDCGGRTSRATTCSTASAISPWIRVPRCCSSTSTRAQRCMSRARATVEWVTPGDIDGGTGRRVSSGRSSRWCRGARIGLHGGSADNVRA